MNTIRRLLRFLARLVCSGAPVGEPGGAAAGIRADLAALGIRGRRLRDVEDYCLRLRTEASVEGRAMRAAYDAADPAAFRSVAVACGNPCRG